MTYKYRKSKPWAEGHRLRREGLRLKYAAGQSSAESGSDTESTTNTPNNSDDISRKTKNETQNQHQRKKGNLACIGCVEIL